MKNLKIEDAFEILYGGPAAPEVEGFSQNDILCKQYLDLSEKIKTLEEAKKKLREQIEHAGTHSTRNFVVTVDKRESLRVPSKAQFLKLYPDGEKHLVKSVTTYVQVKRKGGE